MASSPLPFFFPSTTTSYRAGAIFKFEMCQSAPRHPVLNIIILRYQHRMWGPSLTEVGMWLMTVDHNFLSETVYPQHVIMTEPSDYAIKLSSLHPHRHAEWHGWCSKQDLEHTATRVWVVSFSGNSKGRGSAVVAVNVTNLFYTFTNWFYRKVTH